MFFALITSHYKRGSDNQGREVTESPPARPARLGQAAWPLAGALAVTLAFGALLEGANGPASAQGAPGGAGGTISKELQDCLYRFRWQPQKRLEECGVAGSRSSGSITAEPVTAEIDPMQLGAAYMTSAQTPDGLFLYEFDFLTGSYSDTENLVRQAGAGYALAEYYLYSKDEGVRAAIVSAINAYRHLSVQSGLGMLVTSQGRLSDARAGTTALALLTELQYQEATGDQQAADIRKQWVLGLLGLYREGKGFSERPESDSESPYFNGEGWLALAYYDHLFPNDALVSVVLPKLDSYLIGTNDEDPDIRFFHWGVMAAAKRYEATKDKKFAEFIARQVRAYLEDMRPSVRAHVNSCYSVEGLVAAAATLEASDIEGRLRRRVVERATAEMDKNLGFQIQPGQDRVDLGDGRYLFVKDITSFSGAFLNGLYRPQTRIDFTQHCLSAMVKYQKHGLG